MSERFRTIGPRGEKGVFLLTRSAAIRDTVCRLEPGASDLGSALVGVLWRSLERDGWTVESVGVDLPSDDSWGECLF